MTIRYKALVDIFIEEGLCQESEEHEVSWKPINFHINNACFQEYIEVCVGDWLMTTKLKSNVNYELILAYTVDRDAGGAVTGEWFEVIHEEQQFI